MVALNERQYRFIDPNDIDTTGVEPPEGTNSEVLRDSLLDIIQLSLAHGMSEEDVDEALAMVEDHRAHRQRSRFRIR